MTKAVFLNGRFLSQLVTGVQRFSTEIVGAVDCLMACGEWPDTVILAPRARGPQAGGPTGIHYRRLPLREVGRLRGHLWEQAELPGAARGGVLVSLGNTAPILAGRRQVVVIHDAGIFDTPESYSLRFRAWYKTLQQGLVRTGAQIVTVSNFSRNRIVDRLNLDPDSIFVMHEGAEHILRNPADAATLERHELRPGRFALVVANRVPHKNLAELAEAAAMLERRGIIIAVVGGVNREVFHGIQGAGFAERRLGRVSDSELRALYEGAACLLFPSRYEGFGLPPVEAMACGCPVLAARGGAVEEICTDHALYFNHGDPRSMIVAIERLLDDDTFANDLRTRALAHVAGLNWTAAARALGRVVTKLL